MRPLAVIEGYNPKRKRWEKLFAPTEWAVATGEHIDDAPHYTRLRMTHPAVPLPNECDPPSMGITSFVSTETAE
jgi:hypothetical protein